MKRGALDGVRILGQRDWTGGVSLSKIGWTGKEQAGMGVGGRVGGGNQQQF